MEIESRLADGMRRMGDEPVGPPPTQALLARGRKARRRRRVTWMGGGCLAVAALVAVPVLVLDNRQTPQPDSARIRLVAAVSSSENLSYRLKITSTHTDDAGRHWAYEGVFDPATRTGRLSSVPDNPAGPYDQRLIQGILYISHLGGPFKIMPGRPDRLQYSSLSGGGIAGTADPQELFATLKAANAAVTRTGPASYHFEADLAPSPGIHSDRLVGDVTINNDNRIEKITYERIAQGTQKNGLPITLIDANTVELSGYGQPVTVERPENAVPAPTRPPSPAPWVDVSPTTRR